MPRAATKRGASPRRIAHSRASTEQSTEQSVATERREQVIEAAITIIASEGIHKLSLGNIEKRVKMTRGHLTYYFHTKEAILMAVLDRMLERMIAEKLAGNGPKPMTGKAWPCVKAAIADSLRPPNVEGLALLSLIHTFHAQMSFRNDIRAKIAEIQTRWRNDLATDIAASVRKPPVPPQVIASIVMALLMGLGGQVAVDPNGFDSKRLLAAVTKMLAPLFGEDK